MAKDEIMGYLDVFCARVERRWRGSLVSVREAAALASHAKEYLAQAAARGLVERVTWGWYYLPSPFNGALDFLSKERHFKVLQKQTAASVWNGDFVHREEYAVAVTDASYARALRAFARGRGWGISLEIRDFHPGEYVRREGSYVEALEETIVQCIKEWAFVDAFASLYARRAVIDWRKLGHKQCRGIFPRPGFEGGKLGGVT